MCGRLNVNDDPFSQWVCDALNTQFQTPANHDLRPTQIVAAISSSNQQLQQIDTCWGIKPAWAKKLLINARPKPSPPNPLFAKLLQNTAA